MEKKYLSAAMRIAEVVLKAKPDAPLDQVSEVISEYGELMAHSEDRSTTTRTAAQAADGPRRIAPKAPRPR